MSDKVANELASNVAEIDLEIEGGDVAKKEFLENGEAQVEVTLADSNTLYTSVSTFEDLGLHPDLLKGIYGMGFQKPSRIQEKALPMLLATPPKNMIGQSQSGTGKTAAFVLAMLSRVNFEVQGTQAICLAPARELARQIMDNVREMGKYTPVTTAYAIKESIGKGEKVDAHIVIGTPGTVLDLIKRRALDVSKVRIFVLDEADNMLDQQGLGDQSIRVKKQSKTVQAAVMKDSVRMNAIAMNPSNTVLMVVMSLSIVLIIVLLVALFYVCGVFRKRQKPNRQSLYKEASSRPTSLRIEIPGKSPKDSIQKSKKVTIPPRTTSIYGIPEIPVHELKQALQQTEPTFQGIDRLFVPDTDKRVSFVSMSSVGYDEKSLPSPSSLPDNPQEDTTVGLGISEPSNQGKSVRFANDLEPTPPPKEWTPSEEIGGSLDEEDYRPSAQKHVSTDSDAFI